MVCALPEEETFLSWPHPRSPLLKCLTRQAQTLKFVHNYQKKMSPRFSHMQLPILIFQFLAA